MHKDNVCEHPAGRRVVRYRYHCSNGQWSVGFHLVAGYLLLDFAQGVLVHLDTEDDEGNEAEGDDIGVELHAEDDGVVDAVGNNGNTEHAGDVGGRMTSETITGVVIAHEDGEGIVAWHGQQGARDSYRLPIVGIGKEVGDVLHGGEAQSDTNGIDDAVEMLIEVRIFPQEQPQYQ